MIIFLNQQPCAQPTLMSWRSIFLSRWQHTQCALARSHSIHLSSADLNFVVIFFSVARFPVCKGLHRRLISFSLSVRSLAPFTALGVIIIAPEIKKRVPFHFAPQQFTFFSSPSPNSHLIFPPLSCFIPSPVCSFLILSLSLVAGCAQSAGEKSL